MQLLLFSFISFVQIEGLKGRLAFCGPFDAGVKRCCAMRATIAASC
jgi:hypothetical protein